MEANERDYESEAKQQGWKPQEEFKGDPEKWVPAQVFVERGEQFVGFLKPQLDGIKAQLKQQQQVNKDLHEFHTKQQAKQLRELQGLENQLQAARKKAIDDGDGGAFVKTEAQLKELEKSKQDLQATKPLDPNVPPAWFNDWTSDNPWYGSDTVATRVADGIAEDLRKGGTPLTEKEFMEKVTELTKLELPNKFKNKNKQRAADVEDEGTPGGSSRQNGTFGSLPKDAKAACERMIKQGYIKNTKEAREEYARVYSEE